MLTRRHLRSCAALTGASPRYASSTAWLVWISLGVPDGEDLAEVEHVDRAAEPHDERHVVLDEQHRHALVGQLGSSSAKTSVSPLVEPGRRLVEQQHLGSAGQGPAELDQSGQTGRQRVGALVGDGDAGRRGRGSRSPRSADGQTRSGAQRLRISADVWMFSRAVSEPNTSRRWNVRAMPEVRPLVSAGAR